MKQKKAGIVRGSSGARQELSFHGKVGKRERGVRNSLGVENNADMGNILYEFSWFFFLKAFFQP